MKPEIFNEVEAQLINAFADGILDGVCVLPMAEIISHNSGYEGEKFTVRVADLLSDVLQPLLGTAISDGDVPAIRFLTDAVCYVIDELIPQEQPNG